MRQFSRKIVFLIMGMLVCQGAIASGDITVAVESLTNVKGNGAMEACGSAVHKNGIKPLIVTVKHDQSLYSTLTAPNGKWCVLVKRWTFDGVVTVDATTLTGQP